MFCIGVIDGDHWEFESAIFCHLAEADDTCRGLFAASHNSIEQLSARGVQGIDQIATIIKHQIWFDIQG